MACAIYYLVGRFLPKYPIPGYQFAYKFKYFICKQIFEAIGENVLIKRNAYFGNGAKIRIGDNSQIGINCIMDNDIVIGNDVTMGPDVIIYTCSHEYKDLAVPINKQGEKKYCPVKIGNNVWIGARSIILPGVTIGNNSIIGANTVVTENVPENSVFCGAKGRVVRIRN
ncbi:DapH/DapD/GlmU-related protein [Clostridium sp. 001]|uniref:acyltransferase n=1 Tax=Clostridium sp. 001 TaxID=1970093 RepID=UPI001C2BCAD5|nr:DapH/DapD/GlmU-related protein [Clostridium sp. 001]QXE19771.1 hypothetical protein B5S50_13575 [Clostridium sp. 001]